MIRLALLLLLAGCATADPPPMDLLARVMQDCEGGNTDACSILRGLPRATPAATAAPRPVRRSRTQVQQNTDALMQGVDRARSSPRTTPSPIPGLGPI